MTWSLENLPSSESGFWHFLLKTQATAPGHGRQSRDHPHSKLWESYLQPLREELIGEHVLLSLQVTGALTFRPMGLHGQGNRKTPETRVDNILPEPRAFLPIQTQASMQGWGTSEMPPVCF